jgi:predicted NUDIX family NTP pyrophosphohydrolase
MIGPHMVARSAGLLLYRIGDAGGAEVLIAHPGGPFWERKGDGSWSIPKGEYDEEEDALAAAFREFEEETGLEVPHHDAVFLGELRQPSGKRVTVWALEADLDISGAESNTFELEWPRGSGKVREFPEVDRIEWVQVGLARRMLLKGQAPFLDRLLEATGAGGGFPREGVTPPSRE